MIFELDLEALMRLLLMLNNYSCMVNVSVQCLFRKQLSELANIAHIADEGLVNELPDVWTVWFNHVGAGCIHKTILAPEDLPSHRENWRKQK